MAHCTVIEVKFTSVQVETCVAGTLAKVAVESGALQVLELPFKMESTLP